MIVRLPRAPGEPIMPEPSASRRWRAEPTVAAPADQTLIAALDIGSSKVGALICTPADDGRLQVLGTGQRESRGVKRGYVTDMERERDAVREAVELAERMSGLNIEDVWASFGAGGLVSDLATVEVELGGHQVEQTDIDELLSGGRDAIDRNGQVVLHAHPALYTIDGVEGVKNPLGLHADRLGVDIHVVAADPAPLRNVDYVIRSAHLGVKAIVASPVAAALACLTRRRARAWRRSGRAGRGGHQRLAPRRRHAASGCARSRSAPRTSPTTSPAPSACSAAMPSG